MFPTLKILSTSVILTVIAFSFNKNDVIILFDDNNIVADEWIIEQQKGGEVIFENKTIEIIDAKGCTIWFKHKLNAPIKIGYSATVIDKGGKRDRVSDLNCFWMANDPEHPNNFFKNSHRRAGAFLNYNYLNLYYVGYGGHNNTKTRFRRYDGNQDRPLLPEHDLDAKEFMINANEKIKIELIVNGTVVKYKRNGEVIFEIDDKEVYDSGYFGIRTVNNHMIISDFKVEKISKN